MPGTCPRKGRLQRRGEFEGGKAPPHEESIKDVQPGLAIRCQSDSCLVAAEQATRYGDFEVHFSDRKFVALLSLGALSILLERGCRPLKLPRRSSLPLLDATVTFPKFLRSGNFRVLDRKG